MRKREREAGVCNGVIGRRTPTTTTISGSGYCFDSFVARLCLFVCVCVVCGIFGLAFSVLWTRRINYEFCQRCQAKKIMLCFLVC